MAFDPTLPFVLLDDARAGRATLFHGLAATVRADALAEVVPALSALRALGGDRAGYLAYEAGYALDASLPAPRGVPSPLLWFGQFERVETLGAAQIDALLDVGPAHVGPVAPAIDRAAYDAMLTRIADYIAAGDIYQANATFAAHVATRGHPLALFRRLRAAQQAPYGALVHTGSAWLVSLSPELFFDLSDRTLTTRPMKGTAPRGPTAELDEAGAAALAADPKNRAENLMIVDLLRNDLSRVAEPGSVRVPALFEVERYPTVLQMTSTVTATARGDVDAVDVLTALFPCGSITGAPKLRAMAIIAEVEAEAREAYTGSIGALRADGDAHFNVAIRTLTMQADGARLGLGGGIVADSRADAEWAEALAKAAFLSRTPRAVDLIETMRCEGGVIARRELHLARLATSAAFLEVRYDTAAVETALEAALYRHPGVSRDPSLDLQEMSPRFRRDDDVRVRLLVSTTGAVAVQISPLPPPPTEPVRVVLTPLPVPADDWRLRHKTGDRDFYDAARRASGAFEVLFVRPDGYLTEGSFTSLFVRRDGVMLTPPLTDGLLPGIMRAELIASGEAVEARLTPADLANGFQIGNSLRGLMAARLD
ncbi:aminodeoxychorismate synthase component I [Glacieibacterium frigidum]|uniref:Probable branched-chain-amino-acid aminotransferase n=1 Tax=Glacieibacterium frigidum TaxID=2593303 RepID=A0A552UIR9_9SPHN|nr:aminodeoxychorismate synthase component I [Glacieibacterium frigidum]TRW18091.1 aminodeoxychorismate synthase component I [Glacieibacterium frigidum]